MAAEDVHFLNIFKGKRIKLTLRTSSYLGVVQRINPNKTLVLVDVLSCSDGCNIPGSKLFFGREIVNVELTSEADSGNIHDPALEEHLTVERFQPYKKSITLDDDDDDNEEEFINFVVVDEFHEKFGTAVMHIKKQRVIAVGADGVEAYKLGRLCWLQIATKNKVYLFDILLLGARAFKNGLSMILENKHILKVIHDCRAIAGSLIAQFGVKLTNVFDTQVADVMCFYSETGGFLPDRVSTLQEVVSLHLKVPSSQLLSLQMKLQFTKEMWQKRPCPVPLLKVMALSVIHLQPLRLVLLDALMIDYMDLVDSYISSSHYEPDELQHISMENMLELPRELKQLEQMRHDRQEWAAKHYPVTEQGLLARFNPRTPAETSPADQERSQTQAKESFDPAASPSSPQVDPHPHSSPRSPLRAAIVPSVDVRSSPDPVAQAPVPAATPDLRKEMSVNGPLSLGVGRGRTEVLMMGRGKSFGKEQSSVPALPTMGRGFLFQIPQARKPGESTGDIETPGRMGMAPSCRSHTLPQYGMPQPGHSAANSLLKDTSGLNGDSFTPQFPTSSSLSQSFGSFRY